ncbi:MAG: leucine-rich repeat protein [Bacteroidales bacterium]|nr:leucine-rich repeat protein [Bacteroidales bacterium]
MKKTVCIVAILLVSLKFSVLWAYDFSAVSMGQTLYYTILSDTIPYTVEVTIENNIEMLYTDYPNDSVFIPDSVEYNGKTYAVIGIGNYAFLYCDSITGVRMGENIRYINIGAFYYCEKLNSLHIPNSVVSIDTSAFSFCKNLKMLILSDSLQSISSQAFDYCNELTIVSLPATLIYIGEKAFQRCEKLNTIQVASNNVNYRSQDGILYDYSMDTLLVCPGGKSGKLVIPSSVKYIKDYACAYCMGLSGTLLLPEGLKQIGIRSFSYCTGLVDTLKIPDSVIKIDAAAFDGCEGLKCVIFGNSIEIIGSGAFYGCRNLQGKIIIPYNIKRIESATFMMCENINSVFIGDSINYIGDDAFYACAELNDISIGSSVKHIGVTAFYSEVKEVSIRAVLPPETVYKTFNFDSHPIKLYVPCGSENYYQNDTEWTKFSEIIGGNMDYAIKVSTNNDSYGIAWASPPDCITSQSVLKASPKYGYTFEQWSDGNSDNPRTVIVSSDTSFTAIFKYKVSIEEKDIDNNLNLYPNPSSNQFTLDNGQELMKEVFLYDVIGRKVKHLPVNAPSTTVDVSDLPNGIYVVKISTASGVLVRKVQVVR